MAVRQLEGDSQVERSPGARRCFIAAHPKTNLDTIRAILAERGIEATASYERPWIGARPLDTIMALIEDTDIVIAILDEPTNSANVLFEIGYAFARDKKIMVIQPPRIGSIPSDLGFVQRDGGLGGEGQGSGHAVESGTRDIDHVGSWRRQIGKGDGPQPYADESEGIDEGGERFGVPGGLTNREGLSVKQRVCEEGDQGKEAEQSRGGTEDGEIGPLALGLDAEVRAGLLKGDLELPAQHEPLHDLAGRHGQFGAEERLRVTLAVRITDQHPAQRDDRQARVIPDGGAAGELDEAGLAAVPADQTGAHAVSGSTSRWARFGWRSPFLRGAPRVPGWRTGAGSYSAASNRKRVTTVTGSASPAHAANNSITA